MEVEKPPLASDPAAWGHRGCFLQQMQADVGGKKQRYRGPAAGQGDVPDLQIISHLWHLQKVSLRPRSLSLLNLDAVSVWADEKVRFQT